MMEPARLGDPFSGILPHNVDTGRTPSTIVSLGDSTTTPSTKEYVTSPEFSRSDTLTATEDVPAAEKILKENSLAVTANGKLADQPDEEIKRNNDLSDVIKRIAELEAKIKELESGGKKPEPKPKTETESTEKSPEGEDPPPSPPTPPTIVPVIRRVNWAEFKNRYLDTKEEPAIEALVGGAKFYYQRITENRRQKQRLSSPLDQDTAKGVTKEIPCRIRINSIPVVSILAEIIGEEWSNEPIVILRPFKPLVVFEKEIREAYRKLEAKWGNTETEDEPANKTAAEADDTASANKKPSETKVGSDKNSKDGNPESSLMGSERAYKELHCLVEFIDLYVKPSWERLRGNTTRKVVFSDLWYLFQPGDAVISPPRNQARGQPLKAVENKRIDEAELEAAKGSQERYQTSWRCQSTTDGRPNLSKGTDEDDFSTPKEKTNPFWIRLYHLDWNGKKFGPISHNYNIKPYEGEREITSLEYYPLRYAENYDELRAGFKRNGERFREFVTFKHKYYTGMTLVRHPCGCAIAGDNAPKHPENIDSEVIIDFNETIQNNSDWSLSFGSRPLLPPEAREAKEEYPVLIWKDSEHRELSHSKDDIVYDDDRTDKKLSEDLLASDPLLKDNPEKDFTDGADLTDDNLTIFPSRVYGFVLRNRKFALLKIEDLRPIRASKDGFNSLKLPPGHKKMVQALVKTHFLQKKARAANPEENVMSDIVRGKGEGLIVLLHGAPGVGKTSTAECVAESNGKPLFPITCGDLGLTADDVEQELEEKFHLAQRWDCVLLLDEADVFLAQRTKTDIKRNSLVSVFLRTLEYYTGILFLTTNRVGAFDEAFKSRIHISLYYPPLEERQTLSIWKMNMERTVERKKKKIIIDEDEIMGFALDHYKSSVDKNASWNGRQIRNAFQTAAALAEFDAHEENIKRKKDENLAGQPDAYPKLEKKHFEVVAKASLQFDLYITETAGGFNDAERAYHNQERADQFRLGTLKSSRAVASAPLPQDRQPWPQAGGFEEAPYSLAPRPMGARRLQAANQPSTPTPRAAHYAQRQLSPEQGYGQYQDSGYGHGQGWNPQKAQQMQQQQQPTSETILYHSETGRLPPTGSIDTLLAGSQAADYDDDY
ncbi:MAG: hypothetical protein M1829_001439 [Trizodia sp. TS-e1964]|nr:MAG: hypothetical protein M1829_001439 [Trizodia sp. TS-e1964]